VSLKGAYVVRGNAVEANCDDGASVPHAAALQGCIDKANADGGGTVLVAAGTYSTGTWPIDLKSNVTLMGQGHLGARLAPSGVGMIIGPVGDNTAIVGLTFDQSNLVNSFGNNGAIRFPSGAHANVRIESNLFTATGVSFSTGGVLSPAGANSFQRITIRDNVFQYTGTSTAHFHGIMIGASAGNGPVEFIRIENNDFSSNVGGDDINVFSPGAALAPARGVVISGNSMRHSSSAGGIHLFSVLDAQVSGNSIQGDFFTTAGAVTVEGSMTLPCGATVTGNHFRGTRALIGSECKANTVLSGNTDDGQTTGWGPPAGMGKVGVAVRAYRGGNQTFTAGTETVLVYNNEDADYGGNFDPATGTFTALVAGLYKIRACARFSTANFAAGDTADITLVSGSIAFAFQRTPAGGSTSFTSCVEDTIALGGGQAVQATVNASGTANSRTVSGTGKYSSFFSARKISD
jgi:hypothetical protein